MDSMDSMSFCRRTNEITRTNISINLLSGWAHFCRTNFNFLRINFFFSSSFRTVSLSLYSIFFAPSKFRLYLQSKFIDSKTFKFVRLTSPSYRGLACIWLKQLLIFPLVDEVSWAWSAFEYQNIVAISYINHRSIWKVSINL